MEKRKSDNTTDEVPTIVVERPSTEHLPYVDDEEQLLETSGKKPEVVPGPSDRRESLRRNSISLPNLDHLAVLKDKVKISENATSDDELTDDEIVTYRTPLRNARRKSVTNPRMLRPSGDEENGSYSPANSVTSNTSIAGLLREKIQVVPEAWKKKSPDYKTRIFVAVLFITIVVLVICAYFLYHQKILQKAYFEKVKINNVKKIMRIYDGDGVEIIKIKLGMTVTYDKVLPCLQEDVRNGSKCFEWMRSARLYLMPYMLHGVKCYNLKWISLSKNTDPTDCIILNDDHWYGGGQTQENSWPLEKGNHTFHPFITGHVDKHEWGNVLKRYFVSSNGAAIIVDNDTPLYVSVNANNKKELCIKAMYDDFAFVNRLTPLPELNYSVCASTNMSETHTRLTESTLWDGWKKEDVKIINTLFSEPVWEIYSPTKEDLTEETINNFTNFHDNIKVFKLGHVLINEFWQRSIGDFEVDESRFPTLERTFQKLDRRGFGIVLSVQPYISTESINFAEAVKKRLLISERFSDKRIPALTRYKSLESAGVLDVTNNRTIPWLINKLKGVKEKYKINSYNFDFGVAYDMPHYYQCEKPLTNPDQYKSIFIDGLQGSINIFGVNSAIERPRSSTFVFSPTVESSWDGLRRVIPAILTYGILGFPFIIPSAVGGDYGLPDVSSNYTDEEVFIDQELYIRWLQLATFLPVVRYKYLPMIYKDKAILDAAIALAAIREKEVIPVLKNFSTEAINYAIPIIRPLWMLDPNDPACHTVTDEFAIGDEIIVAPILHPGTIHREIYLPAGVWKDGIDNSYRKGSRWIHEYRVDEDKIAYFKRLPPQVKF